ncbi:MAG TPA: hypothetical protein VIJ94_17810 [Caulobacteraceae bacterium]
MTSEKRHAAISKLIERHTAANTVSKAVARESLIKEGIYTKKGALRVEFGGESKKAKTAARAASRPRSSSATTAATGA